MKNNLKSPQKSSKIPRGGGSARQTQHFKGKLKFSDSRDPWPLASGMASTGRAKHKLMINAIWTSREPLGVYRNTNRVSIVARIWNSELGFKTVDEANVHN